MLRSIASIIAGYAVLAVLTLITFAIIVGFFPSAFPEPNSFPNLPWVILILGAGFVYAIVGGYVTAWLAPQAEFKHVAALAVIMFVLGVFSAVFSPAPQPLWYQIALVVLGLAGVLLGGNLRVSRFS